MVGIQVRVWGNNGLREGARVRGGARNKVRDGESSGVGLICAKNKNKMAID